MHILPRQNISKLDNINIISPVKLIRFTQPARKRATVSSKASDLHRPSSMGSEKPIRSASAIVASTESVQHLLKIVGYSRTKDDVPTGSPIKSRSFCVGGYSWLIYYYPNGLSSAWSDYVSVYLLLEYQVPKGVRAQYTFSLLDHVGKLVPRYTLSSGEEKIFRDHGWGFAAFIKKDEFEKSEHLRDDCFTIRCDITVMKEIHTKDIDVAGAIPQPPPAPVVQVPPPDLHRHLGSLLATGEGADVAFEVDGKTFPAHRLVLAARSPALHAMAKASTATDGPVAVVRIDDMEAADFEAFLHYVYTDTLPETMKGGVAAAMLPDLVAAANRYKMERLRLVCEDKLCEFVSARTVAVMLTFAGEHLCQGLKEACLQFLEDPVNLREVVKINGLEHLTESCPSVLKDIIAKLAAGP